MERGCANELENSNMELDLTLDGEETEMHFEKENLTLFRMIWTRCNHARNYPLLSYTHVPGTIRIFIPTVILRGNVVLYCV